MSAGVCSEPPVAQFPHLYSGNDDPLRDGDEGYVNPINPYTSDAVQRLTCRKRQVVADIVKMFGLMFFLFCFFSQMQFQMFYFKSIKFIAFCIIPSQTTSLLEFL